MKQTLVIALLLLASVIPGMAATTKVPGIDIASGEVNEATMFSAPGSITFNMATATTLIFTNSVDSVVNFTGVPAISNRSRTVNVLVYGDGVSKLTYAGAVIDFVDPPPNPPPPGWTRITFEAFAGSVVSYVSRNSDNVSVVDTISTLLARNPASFPTNIIALGRTIRGDGGGGSLYWVPGSTATTNRGTIFKPWIAGAPEGRFFREYSHALTVKQFGASGDDLTDDSAAFCDGINWFATNGGGRLIVPKGTFTIPGTPGSRITITNSNISLTGEPGAIISLPSAAAPAVAIQINADGSTVTNVHVSGLIIQGSRTGAIAYGLQVNAQGTNDVCRDITIEDIYVNGCRTDGIQVGGNAGGFPRNVVMNRIISEDNFRHGMGIIQVDGLTVNDSIFRYNNGDSLADGVDVEPDAGLQNMNITFNRCSFYNNQDHGLDVKKGLGLVPSDVSANNCSAIANGGDGFRFLNVVRGALLNSTSLSNTTLGAVLTSCTDFSIKGGSFEWNGTAGVQLAASNCSVEGVASRYNGTYGIQLAGAGTTDTLCEFNKIHGNIVALNTLNGILLGGAGYNTVSDNKIFLNQQDGLVVSSSSDHNLFDGNNVEQNGQAGPDNSIENIKIESNSGWNSFQNNHIRKSIKYNTGTAQAGAAGTITLANGATDMDDYYVGQAVYTLGGVGSGQTRIISAYAGSTRVATVSTNWSVTPDSTTVYEVAGLIRPFSGIRVSATNCIGNRLFLNDTFHSGQTADIFDQGTSTLYLAPVTADGFQVSSGADFTLLGGSFQVMSNKNVGFKMPDGTFNPTLSMGSSPHVFLNSYTGGDVYLRPEGDSARSVRVLNSGTLLSTMGVFELGASGIRFTGDNDGAMQLQSLGGGFGENFTLNLDDTQNTAVITSGSGLNLFDFQGIGLQVLTEVYDATAWNGNFTVPTKDAIRDKLETLTLSSFSVGNMSNLFTVSTPTTTPTLAAVDPATHTLYGFDNTDNLPVMINIGTGLAYNHTTHTLTSSGGTGGSATNAYSIVMKDSVAVTARTNLNFIGDSFIVTDDSGNVKTDVDLDSDLDALAANASNGLWARTATGTGSARTLTGPAAGLSITDGDGVAGNPTFALANDLLAVEGLSGLGFAVRTASDTWTTRTNTATEGVQIANGDGVAGNPVIKSDINGLTEDTAPDPAADFVETYDTSTGTHKKVKVDSIGGGSGLNGAYHTKTLTADAFTGLLTMTPTGDLTGFGAHIRCTVVAKSATEIRTVTFTYTVSCQRNDGTGGVAGSAAFNFDEQSMPGPVLLINDTPADGTYTGATSIDIGIQPNPVDWTPTNITLYYQVEKHGPGGITFL